MYYSGHHLALIFEISSETIVGIYLIIKTFKNPMVKYNLLGYILFLIVSIITVMSAKDFSLEQIGYPFCETLLCIGTIIPLLKKWWEER